jgi:glycosyltransferase involved in cell wall biosynthesis
MFARLAANKGIELMVFHGQDVPGTKLVNAADFSGIPHRQLRSYYRDIRSSGRVSGLLVYPGIVSELSQFRPDVILCEGGSNLLNNLLIYPWAEWHGAATIWWSLGELPGREFRGTGKVYKRLIDAMARRSTVLLGYSSRAKRHFESLGCRQPIFVAVNCVDTDAIFARIAAARARPWDVRAKLGLGGRKVVLFVGALTRPKRLDNLLRSYAEIRRMREDVALVIVGDGPARAELETLASSLGVPDVHFVGHVVDRASHYFLSADLFVLPGLGGLAISEAMCHGLPVVCTVADGCEGDLVRDDVNGCVLRENDTGEMVQAISRLLDDPGLARRMGKAGLEMIVGQYNVNSYMNNVLEAIRCAYGRRQSRRV